MFAEPQLFDLESAYGSLVVQGPEAERFLQSQLSLDIARVPEGCAQWACWADAKGRVRSLLHVGQVAGNHWILIAAHDHLAALRKIRMFVLHSQLTICEGPRLVGTLDIKSHPPLHVDSASVALGAGRRIFLDPCLPEMELADAESWRVIGALMGEAQFDAATVGNEIPQNLGLRADAGFSLRKGCYPGQEIISRVHYRGRAPRRLHTSIARTAPEDALFTAPLPGTPFQVAQSLRPNRGHSDANE